MYDIWARLILPCIAEYLEFLLRRQWGNAKLNCESGLQFWCMIKSILSPWSFIPSWSSDILVPTDLDSCCFLFFLPCNLLFKSQSSERSAMYYQLSIFLNNVANVHWFLEMTSDKGNRSRKSEPGSLTQLIWWPLDVSIIIVQNSRQVWEPSCLVNLAVSFLELICWVLAPGNPVAADIYVCVWCAAHRKDGGGCSLHPGGLLEHFSVADHCWGFWPCCFLEQQNFCWTIPRGGQGQWKQLHWHHALCQIPVLTQIYKK